MSVDALLGITVMSVSMTLFAVLLARRVMVKRAVHYSQLDSIDADSLEALMWCLRPQEVTSR